MLVVNAKDLVLEKGTVCFLVLLLDLHGVFLGLLPLLPIVLGRSLLFLSAFLGRRHKGCGVKFVLDALASLCVALEAPLTNESISFLQHVKFINYPFISVSKFREFNIKSIWGPSDSSTEFYFVN